MMTTLLSAVGLTLMLGAAAAAQTLPVKTYREITSFRGDTNRIITSTDNPSARYSLYSGHKEAGRPWADIVVRKDSDAGTLYLSRAYDCAAGTYRVLGQSTKLTELSRNMTPAQARDRLLEPGTLEYKFAFFACGL